MTTTNAALGIIATALYVFAGWQTFRLMVVTDDTDFAAETNAALRHAPAAFWTVVWVFLAFWPAVFLWAKLQARHG